jgi:hypothetical protein
MVNYHLALVAQAKTKNAVIKLLIRESEIIILTMRSRWSHLETRS